MYVCQITSFPLSGWESTILLVLSYSPRRTKIDPPQIVWLWNRCFVLILAHVGNLWACTRIETLGGPLLPSAFSQSIEQMPPSWKITFVQYFRWQAYLPLPSPHKTAPSARSSVTYVRHTRYVCAAHLLVPYSWATLLTPYWSHQLALSCPCVSIRLLQPYCIAGYTTIKWRTGDEGDHTEGFERWASVCSLFLNIICSTSILNIVFVCQCY